MQKNQDLQLKVLTMESDASFIFFSCLFMFVLGGLFNTMAVAENGGKMPVYSTDFAFSDDSHTIINNFSEVKNPKLIDKYPFFGFIFSIGDLIMISSAIGLTFCLFLFSRSSRLKHKYLKSILKEKKNAY